MLPSQYETQDCAVARAMEVVGERWTLLIIRDALHGVTRFDEFIARLGVPTTTLSKRLTQLVDAGIISRHRYGDRPYREEYRLTDRGRELAIVVEALREWGDRHFSPEGPPAQYRHRECGGSVNVAIRCMDCDEELSPESMERIEHRPIRR